MVPSPVARRDSCLIIRRQGNVASNANRNSTVPGSNSSTAKNAEISRQIQMDNDIPMLNAFSVDVEDYFQVSAFENQIARSTWKDYSPRVVENTIRLLDLLDQNVTRGTFFVLGWTANEFPDLVREIRDRGHEIGSHGYWHRLIYRQTPDEFRTDLRDSIKAIQDAADVKVACYRAPSFSITAESEWALQILKEEGLAIDSSIYPIFHDRYGLPNSDPHIHLRETPAGPITEFPPSVLKTPIANLPISGGGYFRLYPSSVSFACYRKINRERQPFVFYVHPWEIDPDQPKIRCGHPVAHWRHHVNLRSTYAKLDALLSKFRFGTLSDTINSHLQTVPLGKMQLPNS
jgi:polysaccharide deacetylase family protein (PEP-CTERM system associated)